MSKNQSLLAIVVPTRNRQQYVVSAIKSLLRIPSNEIEIVIEDNSDTNELQNWILQNVTDTRLIYNYSKEFASQAGNYDRSLRGVTADYVSFIGDDDGVNPEIVEATRWAKANDIDALTPVSLVNYSWPDLHMTGKTALKAGELEIRPFTCNLSFPDGKQEMTKCARDVGQSFHLMPKAYYGIVSRECLDLVKKTTGFYFPGISPDMAAAVSIAIHAKKICYVDYPLFVPGSSHKSLAGVGGMKKHVGKLSDQKHLPPTCEESWSAIIPKFFSVQTIWGEAAVAAICANGQSEVLRQCNILKYYADCLKLHPQYYRSILHQLPNALRAVDQNVGLGIIVFIARAIRQQLARVKGAIYQYRGIVYKTHSYRTSGIPDIETHSYRTSGIPDIEDAVIAFSRYLHEHKQSFNAVVNEKRVK